MVEETKLVDIGSGLAPEGDGWFVVNVRDVAWLRNDALGSSTLYQPPERSPQLGVNVGMLELGKPNCLCHEESDHVFVGAGHGPCVILFIGACRPDAHVVYRVDEVAGRHGAAVTKETPDPAEAYGEFPAYEPAPRKGH